MLRFAVRARAASWLRRGALVLCLALSVEADALAQEPVWSFRVAGGTVVATDGTAQFDVTNGELDRFAAAATVDIIRNLPACCVELFFSGVIAVPGVSVSGADGDAGRLSLSGLQIGMNYRLHRRASAHTRIRKFFYAGPFIGGFSRARSEIVTLRSGTGATSAEAAFTFPGGWGIGVGGGFRYRWDEQFAFDANAKWQHLTGTVGHSGRVSWNPIVLTAGVVVRLF